MKKLIKRNLIFILILILMGLEAALMLRTKTNQEEIMLSLKSYKMVTRCVGRYLIEIPEDTLSISHQRIQDATIETQKITLQEFLQELRTYEEGLKAVKNSRGYKYLYEYGDIPKVKNSRYFITLTSADDTADLTRSITVFKWDSGTKIRIQIEASDWVNSIYRSKVEDTPYAVPDLAINDVPEKRELLFKLASAIRGREKDEIPDEPGICFEGGFLAGKANFTEDLRFLFALSNKPDVSFKFQSDTSLRDLPKDTLLHRLPRIREEIKEPHINGHIIRSGRVDLGPIKAEELLLSSTTAAQIPGHLFTLNANATTSSAMTPYLILDMSNGEFNTFTGDKLEKASFSEDEAVALWDAVSRNLRPRPNGF